MTDYAKIGFRCGIEIHQQLDTAKLFCDCPSIVHDKDPTYAFRRKLRAVAGETGEVDAAAAHEKKKDKIFVYQGRETSSCLVEMDEEPPHDMNGEALQIALTAARLFNCRIVDEIQVMRKTVVDGSNVSGFQRTALVGMDGHIMTSLGKVGIPLVCLEEEAAKKVGSDASSVTFRLDRLGVPLIEVSTTPDILNPAHAKECAEKIGMILRSTGRVKRGIGTIRQDVNISISGGARVEIKGFQDLKSIPSVIDHEIGRQQRLIAKGKSVAMEVRRAEIDGTTTFLRPMPGAARMYPETDIAPITPGTIAVQDVELLEDKMARYSSELGLSADLAKKIAKSEHHKTFERAAAAYPSVGAPFIAETLISAPREIRRKQGMDISGATPEQYQELFSHIASGNVQKSAILDALIAIFSGRFSVADFKGADLSRIEREAKKAISANPGKPFGALMGMVMAALGGKADGKIVSSTLKRLMK